MRRGMEGTDLRGRVSVGAHIHERRPGLWRLTIPAGLEGAYHLAQLDDYGGRARSNFLWHPPVRLQVRSRASALDLPGTWGFGWWNDPFSAQLGLGGAQRRLPALPNAAWFFYASPPNYLALTDDHPAQGFLAATFAAPKLSPALLALGVPLVPSLLWAPTARCVRRLGRRIVREDAQVLEIDVTAWHDYALIWHTDEVRFLVDEQVCSATPISPDGPLGLVMWIDNQYMAFGPDGHLRLGNLAHPEGWMELSDLEVESL
ncbi:MAG: hypothetical protein ACP5HG_03170 [Anaerolineae bacterium]